MTFRFNIDLYSITCCWIDFIFEFYSWEKETEIFDAQSLNLAEQSILYALCRHHLILLTIWLTLIGIDQNPQMLDESLSIKAIRLAEPTKATKIENLQKYFFTQSANRFSPEASKSFQFHCNWKFNRKWNSIFILNSFSMAYCRMNEKHQMAIVVVAFWLIHLSSAKICVEYLVKCKSSQ